MGSLGRTLVIANPAAHSGRGTEHASRIRDFLERYTTATDSFQMDLTEHKGDARGMAQGAAGFDTVIALGGDGLIHGVANGLMAIEQDARPRLGIIPVGTGNDYARTLGIARNKPEDALRQLIGAEERSVELGRVNGECFVQTLSFGLDAAIALETNDVKEGDPSKEGATLFAQAGVRTFMRSSDGFECRVSLDGREMNLTELILAFQVGPTYGGGFVVCPDASPEDGLLSVCYNTKIPSVPHALGLFALARFGMHASSRIIAIDTVRTATVDFDDEVPCQADGERIEGTHFEIEVVPSALRVLIP